MYMSYCKFEGTLAELRACMNDAADHYNEEAEHPVSDREVHCFKTMVEEFYEFMIRTNLLDEYGDLNDLGLEEICESMKKGFGEEDDQA